MNRKVEFLYLRQEDCIKAGGFDMKGTMQAVERSFYLHGKGDFIQPGKPVIRWGGPETEETTGRIMSMPSFLGGLKYAAELDEKLLLGRLAARETAKAEDLMRAAVVDAQKYFDKLYKG